MLSLCQAIQCQVVGWLVHDVCQKAIITNFHPGFAFTDWGNNMKKKKKVRVVCILAEIKTGRLSNTFQTEITPWSPKSGILTQLCHCTSANKHGPGHWTGEGLKLWLCQSANIRVTDHGPYEQHATWTTWHEELQTKLCLKFRYPQRGMEITGKQIRHTQWRMEFILNFGNNKGKFPFVYHLNF